MLSKEFQKLVDDYLPDTRTKEAAPQPVNIMARRYRGGELLLCAESEDAHRGALREAQDFKMTEEPTRTLVAAFVVEQRVREQRGRKIIREKALFYDVFISDSSEHAGVVYSRTEAANVNDDGQNIIIPNVAGGDALYVPLDPNRSCPKFGNIMLRPLLAEDYQEIPTEHATQGQFTPAAV